MPKFRSQLLLEEQIFLYDVWRLAAAGQAMPSRSAFSICAIGSLLPYLSLVEFKNVQTEPRVRLTGSGLRDVFGDCPNEILTKHGIPGSIDTICAVAKSKSPLTGAVQLAGSNRVRVWLRLPLGQNGNVESVLGLDLNIAASRAQNWTNELIQMLS